MSGRFLREVFALVCGLLFLFAAFGAHAGLPDSLARAAGLEAALSASGCACEDAGEELQDAHNAIASAESVEQARELALSHTRKAHSALSKALWMAPFSDSLREAEEGLGSYERRVRSAADPEAVAQEFADLVQIASAGPLPDVTHQSAGLGGGAAWTGGVLGGDLDDDIHVDIGDDDDDGCDFTGGEIIAIVIGFILGIIPGIILLILLC